MYKNKKRFVLFTGVNGKPVYIDVDAVVAVNTDFTGETDNSIISFSGLSDDYFEVLEGVDTVMDAIINA